MEEVRVQMFKVKLGYKIMWQIVAIVAMQQIPYRTW